MPQSDSDGLTEGVLEESGSTMRRIPAGPKGPGGWSCHTFEDGESFAAICLADDCPDRDKRNPDRFKGEVLLAVDLYQESD